MIHQNRRLETGSVTLVALCFVAVLGIALASYLAVSSQAMRLSNRSYVTGTSKHLAEMGLEEALRAFNSNSWSGWTGGDGTTVTWSLSGTTATGTITLPATKYGSSGVRGAVNLRVDNYNAFNLSSVWDASSTYDLNDLVGYNGIWYRCLQNNTNRTPPNIAYWAEAPIPWKWNSGAYRVGDLVNQGGVWYRCNTAHSNHIPPNPSYWTAIPNLSLPWSSSVTYNSMNSVMYYNGTWYSPTALGALLVNALLHIPPLLGLNFTAANISWNWNNSTAYEFDDLIYYQDVWYRCIVAHTNHAPPNSTYWANALSMWAWNGSENYNLNDVVYHSGSSSWYRCVQAHTNHAPPNATYWANAPLLSNAWSSDKTYAAGDLVAYGGIWYRCILAHAPAHAPSNSTYWASAATSSSWNPGTAYAANAHATYGGVWYQCVASNTNKTPNNSSYWTAQSAPVIYAEGVATLPGSNAIRTQLRATVASAPLFPNALAASSTVSVSGGGTIDSFDSDAGTYAAQTGTSTNFSAVVAAGSTSGTAITLASTAVKGYLAAPSSSSSPYAPLYSSGGSVKGYTSAPSPSIDLTHISRSPYIPQFDTRPRGGLSAAFAAANFPKGTALSLAGTLNLGIPGATVPSRYYYNGDLAVGLGSTLAILNINGPVQIYINGDLVMDGSPNGIVNLSDTGSAEIHVADSLKVNIGSDGFTNVSQDPKRLVLICDTSTSSAQNFSDGTNPFYGVIYMPNTANSTGLLVDNTTVQIYGAVSAQRINYSGVNANVHYDTSLRTATFGGIDAPYIISDWRELTDPAEKATFP